MQQSPQMERALNRAARQDNRAVSLEGLGASQRYLGITEVLIDDLTIAIADSLNDAHPRMVYADALPLIKANLDPRTIALACLQGIFDQLGETLVTMQRHCGLLVATELYAAGLRGHSSKAAKGLEEATKVAGTRHSAKSRFKILMNEARRWKYEGANWSTPQQVAVGMWLIDCACQRFPDMFELGRVPSGEYKLELTAQGVITADLLLQSKLLRLQPVHLPLQACPEPWRGFEVQSSDARVNHSTVLVKTLYRKVIGAHRAAIANGRMQPTLDALNALQSVPWAINRGIYDVMCRLRDEGSSMVPVKGRQVAVPKEPKRKREEARRRNARLRNDWLSFAEDMDIASQQSGPFWLRYNLDWRGRIYALSHFNFAREDRVRALFQFSDGVPIGEQGLYWLKYHVATQGEFDRVNKRPIEDRVAWTNEHLDQIAACAKDPLCNRWWQKAENPFVFLAACMELTAAIAQGGSFVTHLPISFDGSCNGLQHLSLLSRDDSTGALVNLVPRNHPSDVYSIVGEAARQQFALDACSDGEFAKVAATCLTMDARKLSKRNTMTFGYSSEAYGMAGQIQEDVMDRLQDEVIDGKRDEHPFAPWHRGFQGRPSRAALYIAKVNYQCIKSRLPRPYAVMRYMQKVSDALAHEAKPVSWTTPMGLPWFNGKYEPIVTRMTLWSRMRGVPIRSLVSKGFSQRILKGESADGIAPNLVHAMDAAHLMAVVLACKAHGITNVATIHDSYSCLAPQVPLFNRLIREELVKIYAKHDVLAEIDAQARRDLTEPNWSRLPPIPDKGNLSLENIVEAKYAFA